MRHMRDAADWTGVTFRSIDVGAGNKPLRYQHEGYQYATQGEWHLAVLLSQMEIPFTPDVPFGLILPDGRPRRFVPDFLFNGVPYVWYGGRRPVLIHGIEAKGKTRQRMFSEKALQNVALLEAQRGVVVKLLSNSTIKQYYNKGRLPLKPFEPSR
jgi:hypothetical protein